jgi:hypothetical protein
MSSVPDYTAYEFANCSASAHAQLLLLLCLRKITHKVRITWYCSSRRPTVPVAPSLHHQAIDMLK